MKVTIGEIAKIVKKLERKPNELKETLRYFFSFEENIHVFGKFCFPDVIVNKSPGFHII